MSQSMKSPFMKILDFVDDIVSGTEKAKSNLFILVAYLVFGACALTVWQHFSDKDFSYICTLAGLVQSLAFFLLLNKMRITRSGAGVSSKTLQLYVLVFVFRLTS